MDSTTTKCKNIEEFITHKNLPSKEGRQGIILSHLLLPLL